MDDNPSILSHISIGTNDFERAIAFYDAVLSPLGCKRLVRVDGGYYTPHLSYRSRRETFASSGSQIFLGLLFPFAHVDIVMTRFMYSH